MFQARSLATPSDLNTELHNLEQMATVVGTPAFKQSLRSLLVAEAAASQASLTYRNASGRLVQEWPASGKVQEVVLAS